eukprot:TRINITY_DN20130_c0_g1_i1.p1 TRINITY_DN20130_c0_g1~~TRINITY_DN20130_c0_g1_i1.p1  ORF type:complete len:258 (-),score=46.02 TRINITY_DN20130_c0_g1_i1:364-1137(-)
MCIRDRSDDEVDAMRTQLTLLQQSGRLANVATEGDGSTHTEEARNLQLCPLSPEAPLFRSLPFHPRVASTVHALLCNDPTQSVCAYLSQTFWKPARHGLGTSWHQDNAYFQVPEGHLGTAMWTAVHDATVSNGTIEVIPGHSHVLDHERDGMSDHHITCTTSVDEQAAVPVELKAGGVVFFAFNTPHCTRSNTTNDSRAGIAYHFLRMDAYRPRAFPLPESAEWVAPVVSGPECSAGEREYGSVQNVFEDIQALRQA